MSAIDSRVVLVEDHPIHSTLAAFPLVCFTLALFTDIAFWQTSLILWQNFSAWLLFAGLVFGGLAAVVGIFDAIFRRSSPSRRRRGWLHGLLSLVVLALAFVNSLVHAGDGWTAVVPYGLALSLATVVLMIIAGLLGRRAAIASYSGSRSHD